MTDHLQTKQSNRLIFLGLVLFLLGLFTGLFVQQMANPRMGLSAHLEGVLNGMFLMILGLLWKRLLLSRFWFNTAYGLVVYGTFTNLIVVIISAVTGFGKMMPVAGGKEGGPGIEGLIAFMLISLSLCMLAACIIVITGFYRNMMNVPEQVS